MFIAKNLERIGDQATNIAEFITFEIPGDELAADRPKNDPPDHGSRDTGNAASKIAGHTFQVLDYSEGLVRVGVQSAIPHPETAKFIRKLLAERGLPVPPENRNVDSICVVEICQ
jgi:hypothetical protein